MKKAAVLALILLIAVMVRPALSKGNYRIEINGQSMDVDLGRIYNATLPSGEKISFRIDLKKVVRFEDDFVSFEHPGDKTVNTAKIDPEISQVLMSTALGAAILIQEYSSMDPAPLIEMMLQQITKEEVNYGYTLEKNATSRTLSDGSVLKGITASSAYRNDMKLYEIVTHSARDRGVLILTTIDHDSPEHEKKLIQDFWRTLKIKK